MVLGTLRVTKPHFMENPIFKKYHWKEYIAYGALAAVGYMVPAFFFISQARFEDTWWLYVGNGIFLLCIFIYAVILTSKPYDKNSAMSMLMAGHLTTGVGVVITCILLALSCMLFMPTANAILPDAPATITEGKVGSILFIVFVNAILGNFLGGSFISLITSYAVKRNQTKDKPAVLE
jgi:MFS family permease